MTQGTYTKLIKKGMGQQYKEYRQAFEAGKGKEINSPLEPPERNVAL